jgi:sulfatase maturation enzyme AslB (radical SAM superfamily)
MKSLKSKKKSKKVYKLYALEITTTEGCNFRCSYCFEKGIAPNVFDNNHADLLVKRINELLDNEWFKKEYEGLKIIFWGGEPTLNMLLCETIIKAFEDDERVCFFMYTNGSTMDKFINTLKRMKTKPFIDKESSKFIVQVSYDGNPINDNCRVPKDKDCQSSIIVLNAIKLLQENDIEFGLKATLSWDNFHWLPLVWDDFYSLYKEFGKNIKYSVTVDYYDVQFRKYADIVRESILNIARKEIMFYRQNGTFLSNIFGNNKAICATGKSMATVDTKGDISYCHGCLYSKSKFKYSSIFYDDFIDSIKRSHDFFVDHEAEPEECKNCIAGLCLRCNVRKYDASTKTKFEDRWFDYTSQDELCDYYKMVGKIGTALRLILREEK